MITHRLKKEEMMEELRKEADISDEHITYCEMMAMLGDPSYV